MAIKLFSACDPIHNWLPSARHSCWCTRSQYLYQKADSIFQMHRARQSNPGHRVTAVTGVATAATEVGMGHWATPIGGVRTKVVDAAIVQGSAALNHDVGCVQERASPFGAQQSDMMSPQMSERHADASAPLRWDMR